MAMVNAKSLLVFCMIITGCLIYSVCYVNPSPQGFPLSEGFAAVDYSNMTTLVTDIDT